MINVTVLVGSEQQYNGIEMIGHAGYAENPVPNQDLVCSAASALILNMANSVEHFTDDRFEAEEDENSGLLRFRFTDETVSPEGRLLLNSLVFGLLDIEETYGGEPYIRIQFKEV
ncbi:MAG: ribosomal-processing cysteine protease Prp [Clostridiales bacterium]|nr:ribosomal-processing cysteine protease Prp [Clostridiales bacterium]